MKHLLVERAARDKKIEEQIFTGNVACPASNTRPYHPLSTAASVQRLFGPGDTTSDGMSSFQFSNSYLGAPCSSYEKGNSPLRGLAVDVDMVALQAHAACSKSACDHVGGRPRRLGLRPRRPPPRGDLCTPLLLSPAGARGKSSGLRQSLGMLLVALGRR